MKIIKLMQENGSYLIRIINNKNQQLNIYFAGNLDLYWSYYDDEPFNYESINTKKTFEITKTDYFLYSLFEELYNNIKNYKVEFPYSMNTYELLYNNKIIQWISDDTIEEEANRVRISQKKDKIVLEFEQRESFCTNYSIRFCNSGSRYHPFNFEFMKMYRKLGEYDENYQQIHIEEYLYQEKMQQKTLKKQK